MTRNPPIPSSDMLSRCFVPLLLLWFSCAAAPGVPAAAPRVAVSVSAPEEQAATWQALLTAELSAPPSTPATPSPAPAETATWQIVERAELARIWQERARDTDLAALGSVAVYLHFRQVQPDRWILDTVDAAGGRSLGSVAVEGVAGPEDAGKLADKARALLSTAIGRLVAEASRETRGRRIAVVEIEPARTPSPESGASSSSVTPEKRSAEEDDATRLFMLASRLRAALAENGVTVLDRALTQEVVIERREAERGLRDAAPSSAFLGVDCWLEIGPAVVPEQARVALRAGPGPCVETRLVRVRDGTCIGARIIVCPDARLVDAIQVWLLPLLRDDAAGAEPPPEPYLPTVEVEALEPFYRGLALYDAGRFIEATSEFTRAWLLNGRFLEAREWETRCYDALGMAPLAASMRRHMEFALVENIPAASAHTHSTGGIMFAGVGRAARDEGAGRGVGGDARGKRLADALAVRLSAAAASALSSRPELDIRLPDRLRRLRQEYDWMSGIGKRSGDGWEQAPGLFCRTSLSGRIDKIPDDGGLVVSWILRDTISGGAIAGKTQTLAANWQPGDVVRFFEDWPGPSEIAARAGARPDAGIGDGERLPPSDSPERLAALQRSGSRSQEAILRLALAAPDHPAAGARKFEKGDSGSIENLAQFLDYGLRDWLISRLPEKHEKRRWLELARLFDHAGPHSPGEQYSGLVIPFGPALEEFIAASPPDGPGVLARYNRLLDRQALIPPGQLADECGALLADLRAAHPDSIVHHRWLLGMTESLQRMARIAGGDASVEAWVEWGPERPAARRARPAWQNSGEMYLIRENRRFSLLNYEGLTPEEKIAEARAFLAVNGKARGTVRLERSVLKQHPRSLAVALELGEELRQIENAKGLPILHPFDYDAWAEDMREVVAYVDETLLHWLARAGNESLVNALNWQATRFCSRLNERALSEVVTEAEFLRIRDRLAAGYAEACKRPGVKPRLPRADIVPWQTLTRARMVDIRRDILQESHDWALYEPAALEREQARLARVALGADGIFNPMPWWDYMRLWNVNRAFTAREKAQFYLARTSDVLRVYETEDPDTIVMPRLYEHALALFMGEEYEAAEAVFQRLVEIRGDGKWRGTPFYQTIRANVSFRRAQWLRMQSRIPEAIEEASRGIGLCIDNRPWLIDSRYDWRWGKDSLLGHLLRLLRELRYAPARATLPERTGVVTIPTRNGDNPWLHVFYRVPPPPEPGARAGGGETAAQERGESEYSKDGYRVLVVVPVFNSDALEILRPGGAWPAFADVHGLVLVVPEFHGSATTNRAESRFTRAHFVQTWSGEALLSAFGEIGRIVPIRKNRLLLHGVTGGGGFATHFAAWRPDLVEAVSVNNGNRYMPRYAEPGLRPMRDWRGVRFFVSAAEGDNFVSGDFAPRHATAVDFVTRLRGAGVDVEWRSYPNAPHLPTLEMEEAARAFLARQLRP
ncbi:hypothetical protein OpiT1DRAFT_02479 [Opitutaceae bacterium TAV1]|nr:hypothetical protein OpiT1DRAFT_02479 [Opitutaceae bacterium TAV1]